MKQMDFEGADIQTNDIFKIIILLFSVTIYSIS